MNKRRKAQGISAAKVTKRANQTAAESSVRRALTFHQAGNVRDAELLYRDVLSLDPNSVAALHFLGLLLHQTGRSLEGLPFVEKSVRSAKHNPDFLNNLGTVQLDRGLLDSAVKSFRAALAAKPDHKAALANLGAVQRQLGNTEIAEQIFRKIIIRDPFDKQARLALADTLHEAGRSEEALARLREALNLRPRDAEFHHRLGVVHMEKGDLDAAAKCLRIAISLAPDMAEAWLALSQIKKHGETDAELAAMERLHAQTPVGSGDRMKLSFGIGKAYDDLKLYDQAFDFFEEGNSIFRATGGYDREAARVDFLNMKKTFDASLFRDKASTKTSGETPIFIVGMPRSGTTLVEQIISSHPRVHGAGESRLLQTVIDRYFPADMQGGFPEGAAALPRDIFLAAGSAYLGELRKRYSNKLHVTDKMPGNFLLIGFIHLMLPNAKIIHCVREPAATCFSIYKTLFRSKVHGYGYDLAELAEFHGFYTDMMDHWRSVLPDVVHDVHYEQLVTDPENQIRDLIAYCGLSWDETCLAFYESKRSVRTASVAQVRQPIYQGSVDSWMRYGDKLKPLLESLGTVRPNPN